MKITTSIKIVAVESYNANDVAAVTAELHLPDIEATRHEKLTPAEVDRLADHADAALAEMKRKLHEQLDTLAECAAGRARNERRIREEEEARII